MMRPMFAEFEMHLSHLERQLARPGRARASAVKEARMIIRHLLMEVVHGSPSRTGMDPEMSHSFSLLLRRAEMAATAEEIMNVVRDVRQYLLAASSFGRARDMEERLCELEGRIKASAENAAMDGPALDDDVVTLESLRGKRVLFAIMPFSEEFRDVWIGGIKRAAAGTGLIPVRIDMITRSSEITDDIVAAIDLAEIVVADVTQNNPNVMFEFGFALAKGKSHAVIGQSTEFLTFDIKNLRTLIYKNTWQGIEGLHKDLQAFIKGAVGKPDDKGGGKGKRSGERRPTSR